MFKVVVRTLRIMSYAGIGVLAVWMLPNSLSAQPQCGGISTAQVACEGYGATPAEALANLMACIQYNALTAQVQGCQGKCQQVGYACRPISVQFSPNAATYVQPQNPSLPHGYIYQGPVTVSCGCVPDLCGNPVVVPGNGYLITAQGCGATADRAGNIARFNALKIAHAYISAVCSKQTCRVPLTCKVPINYVNEASVYWYVINHILPMPALSSPVAGPGGQQCVTATLTINAFQCRCSQ